MLLNGRRGPGARRSQVGLEQQVVEAWQRFVVDGRALLDQAMVIASGRL